MSQTTKKPGLVRVALGWVWSAIKFPFQTLAVMMAVILLLSWCLLLNLPATARGNNRDLFFLSLRCMDFETSRVVRPFYLIEPRDRISSLTFDMRKSQGQRVLTPEFYRASNERAGRVWDMTNPLERQTVIAWGEGLLRMGVWLNEDKNQLPRGTNRTATADEAIALAVAMLDGIQPNAPRDVVRLDELAKSAYPNEADRRAALAWAGGLYDGIADIEKAYHGEGRTRKSGLASEDITTVLPPRTERTLWWLVYQYLGLDGNSRAVAEKHWAGLFYEGRRGHILAIGEGIEKQRRAAGEALPPHTGALPWVCLVERYQGLDPRGQADRALIQKTYSRSTQGMFTIALLAANPSDDIFTVVFGGDPMRLVFEGDWPVVVIIVLLCSYGMRLFLFPILAEFFLRMHNNGMYRVYRDHRGHGSFAVRLLGYIGIPLVAWGVAMVHLPEMLVPVAGSPSAMLLTAFASVLLGGLLVTVITRVTAFVLLRRGVDVNKVWYDEYIGLTLSLLTLSYFGNDWVNLLIFASAELVPMALQRRPKPEELPMVEEAEEIPTVTLADDEDDQPRRRWRG